MKNFLLAFFVFLLWSLFGMWHYTCNIKGLCNDDKQDNAIETVSEDSLESKTETKQNESDNLSSNPFEFRDESGNLLFTFPNNLIVSKNSNAVKLPDSFDEFKESVFKFLNDNQGKELEITGLLNANESNIDSDLGEQRASFIKNLLVKFGLNADRISVKSKLQEYLYNADGEYSGGIMFDFIDLSEEKLRAIESGIANKTLYSGFASKEFKPDNTLQAYALELKNYLTKYPSKKAKIIGHTDSTGDEEANDWFGMERAKNVKAYLESQGIDGNKLMASSKGETEPVESNATIEGRRKNRRIEIKVN